MAGKLLSVTPNGRSPSRRAPPAAGLVVPAGVVRPTVSPRAQVSPETAKAGTLNANRDIAAWRRGGTIVKVPAGDSKKLIDGRRGGLKVASGTAVVLGAIVERGLTGE